MRRSRSRAHTLIEFMAAIGLVGTILVVLGRFGTFAVRWNEAASASVHAAETAERVRRALRDVAGETFPPIERLSAGPHTWTQGERTLILAWKDGAFVLAQSGTKLIAWKVTAGGAAIRRDDLGSDLERASFELDRDPAGRARGVRFALAFRRRTIPERG